VKGIEEEFPASRAGAGEAGVDLFRGEENGMNGVRRKFWGWGLEGQGLSEGEREALRAAVAWRYGNEAPDAIAPPTVEEIDLLPPRISVPGSLAEVCTADPYERLLHSYGKSFPDSVRAFRRSYPHPPDVVAYPRREQDIIDVLAWAEESRAAAIPFGGGSSVCGGVEPDVGGDYAGTVSIDLLHLGRVLDVDRTSRAARIQAGARGPDLESQLKPYGLTLRHFPQSFEHSTLGGWIATRSGGHYATLYTHIDDFVESTRLVTPRGVLETRRLPGSGAGPSPDRMVIGSEGILGILTEAWVRLQSIPTFRGSAAVLFPDFFAGVAAVRALSQSGLYPSNCRLIDPLETERSGAGDGSTALLVLGFESADHPVDAWMARALELVKDHHGTVKSPDEGAEAHRSGAVGRWRDAFLRAPFYREVLTPLGVISDTFETAITWDRFESFHDTIKSEIAGAITKVTGHPGFISCRFTHVYPDGPAPYFSFQGLGRFDSMLEQWRDIKAAANEVVVRLGGTVTHHHAVGRDHRSGYDAQRPPLFAAALQAAKKCLDPAGTLNPGVLIDPAGRELGPTGVMARR
jgi:alkyldihydroxyacetonephosphate synthase